MDFKTFNYTSLDSTNEEAKRLIQFHNPPFCVIAKMQTQGKGTHGKSFYSPKDKGLYLSFAIKPQFNEAQVQNLTLNIAQKISQFLNDTYTLETIVKKPNDIMFAQKKLCGILTEGIFNTRSKQYDGLVVGIGLNVKKDNQIPVDLIDTITSLEQITQHKIDLEKLTQSLMHVIFQYIEQGVFI